jgi:6-phosphogluconolactonase
MEAGASAFVAAARAAIGARGRFVTALSGGSTPRALYELLATERFASAVDWTRVYVCWGDERVGPPDAPTSNYRMAREALLDHVPIPASQVLRIRGEDAAQAAAAAYERALRELFSTPVGAPRPELGAGFDLVLLGMGDNGHAASLFPGLHALHEAERWVVAEFVPEVGTIRVTLTPVVLNAAVEVMFLVAGADKAAMLHRVLDGPTTPDTLPAQVVAPHGRLRWLVDAAAAARLEGH